MSGDTQTRELLLWIDARPRTYDEAIDAWKTHCPRLSIWDDALIDGLVRVSRGPAAGATLELTRLGRAALDGEHPR